MKIAAVVLAAGGSTRMGEPKQTLAFGGSSMLRISVESAVGAGCDPVFVVLGANRAKVAQCLAGLPVHFVDNPQWTLGMGSSLRLGVEAAMANSSLDALLLMLADQPKVSSSALKRLIEAAKSDASFQIVASEYLNTLGAPAIFRRSVFEEMLRLDPREGAKKMMRDPRFPVASVPMPEAILDIDTPDDYRRALLDAETTKETYD